MVNIRPNRLLIALRVAVALLVLGAPGGGVVAQPATGAIARIAVNQLPPSLGDPFRATGAPPLLTWSALFDPMVLIDGEGAVQPSLARSWRQTDNLTWRFELAPDVRFHDGSALTADDIVTSIAFLLTPEGQTTIVASGIDDLAGVRAVGPLTVEVTTSAPNPLLFREIAGVRPVEGETWQRLGSAGFARAPVGTGPFRVVDWSPSRLRTVAHTGGLRTARLAGLTFIQIADAPARLQALLSSQVDLAFGLGPDDVAAVERSGGRMHYNPWASIMAWIFNTQRGGPLADRRVRLALNHAVNSQAIVDGLLAGIAPLASQPTPPDAFGYDPELQPFAYDPARARALLAEAGYPDGFAMTADVVVNFLPNDVAVYQQVAADLAKVGVRVTLQPVSMAQFITGNLAGTLDGDAINRGFATAPSGDALRPMRINGCDWHHVVYCNREVQAAVDAAYAATDLDSRLAHTRKAMRLMRDDGQSLLLHQVIDFIGLSGAIRGFAAAGTWPLWEQLELVE